MLTVHHLRRSQSERIVWLCEELGLDYELRGYDRNRTDLLAPPDPGRAPRRPAGGTCGGTLAAHAARARALARRHRCAQVPYPAGAALSAADIMSVFSFTTMRLFFPFDLASYPHILAWLQRIGQRGAHRRAMAKGDPVSSRCSVRRRESGKAPRTASGARCSARQWARCCGGGVGRALPISPLKRGAGIPLV